MYERKRIYWTDKMGSEIHKTVFNEQDYEAFEQACLAELDFVKKLFAQGDKYFSEAYRIGYEGSVNLTV
ncbi:MAG: hypothetical protein IE885_03955 [Campylobacterales bacterium]|nr:hypothetical protein [Campylobacterales bacterium]